LDLLTEHIQEPTLQYMLFVDDIVLLGEMRGNERLETWRHDLDAYGFCLIRNKTEYTECKFSSR
jgi:hypothetical protein